MKAKDIIVGEHYAVGRADYPDRAIVLEVGRIERTVHSGARWDWGGHNSDSPAARIRKLHRDGSTLDAARTNVERVVPLSQVLHPWAKQVEVDAQRDAYRVAKEARGAAAALLAGRLEEALNGAGVNVHASRNPRGYIEISCSPAAAGVLLSLLENKS